LYVEDSGKSTEIIIVDDGSIDGTSEWAREQAVNNQIIRVVSYETNMGKGYAVKQGILNAKGESILFLDADGSTPISDSNLVWPLLEGNHADLVIGSRRVDNSNVIKEQSLARKCAGYFFGCFTRAFVVYGIQDTQCGFKAFRKDVAKSIFSTLSSPTAIFDIEILILAALSNLKIAQVPVNWTHDNNSRITYNLKKSIAIFLELARLKFKYKILFSLKLNILIPTEKLTHNYY